MKKKLTQKDVDGYMAESFAKSKAYPSKLINLEHYVYNLIPQAITMTALELSRDFNFGTEDLSAMIRKAVGKLGYLSEHDKTVLHTVFPHWQFFDKELKSGQEHELDHIHSLFKARFPYESTKITNFLAKLRHWVLENDYKINIKGRLFNKVLVVTR